MASTTYRFRSSLHGGDAQDARGRPYPFLLWFGTTSAVAILLMLLTVTSFLTRFVEAAAGYFQGNGRTDKGDFVEFLAHLAALPGVLRTNVYNLERKVLWSSDPRLIGRRFGENDELERAFAGGIVFNTGIVGQAGKAEHAQLGTPGDRFVENYLPIWASPSWTPQGHHGPPIGVIEIYRTPADLWRTIEASQQRVWWGGVGVALLLYVRQQAALAEAERLAIAGEMASAVAHGLRNPLASIRSTAELGLESEPTMRELLDEVVVQTDRLEGWIRQYLATARDDPSGLAAADLRATLQTCLGTLQPQLLRCGTSVGTRLPAVLPQVRCHPVILQQALNSVLANAIEAMGEGGRLQIASRPGQGTTVTLVLPTVPATGAWGEPA